jgi:hypothetical protein
MRLAMALADEVSYHGEEDSAAASLAILSEAAETFDLWDVFEEIDQLKPLAKYKPS